jgi:hypothetical protein
MDAENTSTRGSSSWKLQTIRSHLALRSNFLAVSTINDWNSLSEHVVSSKSLNQFKSWLEKNSPARAIPNKGYWKKSDLTNYRPGNYKLHSLTEEPEVQVYKCKCEP